MYRDAGDAALGVAGDPGEVPQERAEKRRARHSKVAWKVYGGPAAGLPLPCVSYG